MFKLIRSHIEKAYGITLMKGDGYFWFDGEAVDTNATGVYVYRVTDLTVDEWISEAKAALKTDLTWKVIIWNTSSIYSQKP